MPEALIQLGSRNNTSFLRNQEYETVASPPFFAFSGLRTGTQATWSVKIGLFYIIQREAGVVPSIVKKEKRAEYIQSLADSQAAGNESEFMDYMMRHHIENMEEQIREYQESINNDTINTKNDTLNDTIKLSPKEQAVFDIIKTDPNVTIDGIIAATGFSRPTVARAISTLKEKSLLERIGSRKTGSWKIV